MDNLSFRVHLTKCFIVDSDSLALDSVLKYWPRGYKTFFMLNSIEHEILNAHKYKISRIRLSLGSDKPRMLFFTLINVKMLTIVGILTFIGRKNFMLNSTEHEMFSAHKSKKCQQLLLSMKYFLLIKVKMPTIVSILTFMSGKNSILGLSVPKESRILDILYLCAFKTSCSIELSLKKVL